jgi:hypothetical protein
METKVRISNNWRNRIDIKSHFTDKKTTPEHTVTLCETLIRQLKKIREREVNGNLCDYSKGDVDNKLEEIIDHLEFLRDLANGAIPENNSEGRILESEWADYDFDGDFNDMFNGYMRELYDLGDERVDTTANVREKFIWIQ